MVLVCSDFSLNVSEKKMKKAARIMKTATEDSIAAWPEITSNLKTGQLIILCRHVNHNLYFTFGAVQSCKEGLHLIKAEGLNGRESYAQWVTLSGARYCTV